MHFRLPSILSFGCQRQHPTCMYLSPSVCRMPRPSHRLDLIIQMIVSAKTHTHIHTHHTHIHTTHTHTHHTHIHTTHTQVRTFECQRMLSLDCSASYNVGWRVDTGVSRWPCCAVRLIRYKQSNKFVINPYLTLVTLSNKCITETIQ